MKRAFLSLCLITVLAGCGGGGGDSTAISTYVGATNQALITASNAKELSADVYDGVLTASEVIVANVSDSSTGSTIPSIFSVASSINEAAANGVKKTLDTSEVSKAAVVTVQDTIYGAAGSYTFVFNINEDTGSFSGTISFSYYQAYTTDTTTINGSITCTGNVNLYTEEITRITVTMHGLQITGDMVSSTLDGTESLIVSGSTVTFIASVVFNDLLHNKSYWLKDFNLTVNGSTSIVSGKYYHSDYGYVAISTVSPLVNSSVYDMPTGGQLLFSGSNGTDVRLTFTLTGYTMEADTTGTGTYVAIP
jgi:hypothetical protein